MNIIKHCAYASIVSLQKAGFVTLTDKELEWLKDSISPSQILFDCPYIDIPIITAINNGYAILWSKHLAYFLYSLSIPQTIVLNVTVLEHESPYLELVEVNEGDIENSFCCNGYKRIREYSTPAVTKQNCNGSTLIVYIHTAVDPADPPYNPAEFITNTMTKRDSTLCISKDNIIYSCSILYQATTVCEGLDIDNNESVEYTDYTIRTYRDKLCSIPSLTSTGIQPICAMNEELIDSMDIWYNLQILTGKLLI